MTGRFLVIVGDGRNLGRRSVPDEMPEVFRSSGVAIYASAPEPSLSSRLCVIGHVFPRGRGLAPIASFDGMVEQATIRSRGRSLIGDFWGGYIAIVVGDDGDVTVLRDPSGIVSCYVATVDHCTLFSNDAALLSKSNRGTSIDYVQVGRLLASEWRDRSTCLVGIDEVIPGEAVLVRHGQRTTETYWSPWDFVTVAGSPTQDFSEELQATIIDCVTRWTGCYRAAVLNVSGGLDSSVVAAAAVHSPCHIRCLTMIGPDADGDETPYARALADALDLPLEDRRYEIGSIDLGKPALPHLPRPTGGYYLQAAEQAHRSMHERRAIYAILTGNGGDNVFCSIRSAAPLIDRLKALDFRGLRQTLDDIMGLTGASATTVLALAANKLVQTVPKARIDGSGLKRDIADLARMAPTLHPWLYPPSRPAPGKAFHVADLARALRSVELYDPAVAPPHVPPLLSQPIVELCLSIPSWNWIAGGRDRAVVRDAFAGLLPRTISNRASKGGPDGFMHSLVRERGSEIRELLRNGHLVQQGVVDENFVRTATTHGRMGRLNARRLLTLASAEAWTRHWSAVAQPCDPWNC